MTISGRILDDIRSHIKEKKKIRCLFLIINFKETTRNQHGSIEMFKKVPEIFETFMIKKLL